MEENLELIEVNINKTKQQHQVLDNLIEYYEIISRLESEANQYGK